MIQRALQATRAITRKRLAVLVVAALAVAIPVVRGTSSARASATPALAVVIDGRGNGHGGGLSQWGSLGWATLHDKSWQEILGIYYTGTALDVARDSDFKRTPVGRMLVQLSALDGLQTAVISESGALHTAADPAGRAWGALVAREVPGTTNVYDVWGRTSPSCPAGADSLDPPDDGSPDSTLPEESTTSAPSDASTSTAAPSTSSAAPAGSETSTSTASSLAPARVTASATTGPVGWVRVAAGVAGPITFTATKTDRSDAVAPRDLIGVCQKNKAVRYYRGTVSAVNNSAGRNYTFNTVLLDDYLLGVVPRESPAAWAKAGGGKGMHALRAQAVAARSYALAASPRSSGAKICDTSSCQVYGGAAWRPSVGGTLTRLENTATNQAVADTAGQILRYASGGVALTVFSSSNGGRSINNGLYQAVDDPGDAIAANPHHAWSLTAPASSIVAVWPQLGELLDIRVTKRSGGGVWDGWVDTLELEGTNTTVKLTGDQFRRGMGLKSRYLNFTVLTAAGTEEVGPGLFIGDGVSAAATTELQTQLATGYNLTLDAAAGRCAAKTTLGACSTNNGLSALARAATPAYAIVQLGYRDPASTIAASIDKTMAAMLKRGVARVLWVNLSERRRNADGSSTFAAHNAALAEAAARWPQLTVLDWNTVSGGTDGDRWFVRGTATAPDFITLTTSGRTQFALYVRTQLDALRAEGLVPATVNTVPITTVPGAPTSAPTTSTTVASTATSPTTLAPDSTSTTATPTTAAPATTLAAIKKRVLRIGTTGSLVRTLQQRLVDLGYAVKVDGKFGRITRQQVRAFQRTNRLTPDGVVGARTWRALGY